MSQYVLSGFVNPLLINMMQPYGRLREPSVLL